MVRLSDADRERIADVLARHAAAGRLTVEELEDRVEALYRAGLSPRRLAATVTGGRAVRLARAIRDVLGEAIEAGGSSLRDYVQANGELGYFQHRWAVYGREGEPCPGCTCAEGVRRISQSGRSTFFCAKKQR